jgi:hypothetical protein
MQVQVSAASTVDSQQSTVDVLSTVNCGLSTEAPPEARESPVDTMSRSLP